VGDGGHVRTNALPAPVPGAGPVRRPAGATACGRGPVDV